MTDFQKYYLDCYTAKEASILRPALSLLVNKGILGLGNRYQGLLGGAARGLGKLSERLASKATAARSANMARRNVWNGRVGRFDKAIDNAVNGIGQFGRNAVNGVNQFGRNAINGVNQFGRNAVNGMGQAGRNVLNEASQLGKGVGNTLDKYTPQMVELLKYGGAGALGAYLQNKWQNN